MKSFTKTVRVSAITYKRWKRVTQLFNVTAIADKILSDSDLTSYGLTEIERLEYAQAAGELRSMGQAVAIGTHTLSDMSPIELFVAILHACEIMESAYWEIN